MKKWIYSRTFRTRIWLSIILFTVSAVMVSGFISSFLALNILEKKSYSLNQAMIDKSAQALEEKLRKIRLAVLTFISSNQTGQILAQSLAGEEFNYYNNYKMNQSLQTSIFQMKLVEPSITSVLFHTPIGEFQSMQDVRLENNSFSSSVLYPYFDHYQFPIWVETHQDDLFKSEQNVLSLLTVPYWEGVLTNTQVVINVSEASLSEYLMQNSGDSVLMVLTDKHKLAFRSESLTEKLAADQPFLNQLKGQKGYFEYNFEGTKYMVNYSTVSFPDNWLMIHLMSKNALLKDVRLIQWFTYATIIIFIILTLLASRKITSVLLKPLNHLQSVMKQVEQNNLSVRFKGEYQDELSHVGYRFNSMLDQIELLIQQRMGAEQAERIAEMKVLQAQINPHFLYNTLNTILWKSYSNEHDEVREMIMSLSMLFRIGLNNGAELTTVEKELEHVHEYLRIQKLCYAGKFEYTIECGEELKQLPVLKLLLQPLVENTILHGFKDFRAGGKISITIAKNDKSFVISVEDNGQGFDAHGQMRELEKHETSIRSGYALHNIFKRLSLYYSGLARLSMTSVPFEVTRIEICIPLKKGGPFDETAIQNGDY